jgi:signal transduction histidine kinase
MMTLLACLLAGVLAWRCRRLRAALASAQQDVEQLRTAAAAAVAAGASEEAYQLECQRFTAMLSHEFRAPLATIDGVIQSLEMTADDATEATRKRYRKMGSALARLLALVDEYLSPQRMARIGRARAANHISASVLLEGALAQADGSRHRITLQMEQMLDLPTMLRVEPDAMRICLQVLLDNAVNYAPPGGNIELIGRLAPQGGIEIAVQDDGPGVAAQDRAQVFDKFFRGSNAGAHAGSGLGLYIAKSVVEAQGGTLTLQKSPAGGAAFVIWLPAGVVAGKCLASVACNSDNSVTQAVLAADRTNA